MSAEKANCGSAKIGDLWRQLGGRKMGLLDVLN